MDRHTPTTSVLRRNITCSPYCLFRFTEHADSKTQQRSTRWLSRAELPWLCPSSSAHQVKIIRNRCTCEIQLVSLAPSLARTCKTLLQTRADVPQVNVKSGHFCPSSHRTQPSGTILISHLHVHGLPVSSILRGPQKIMSSDVLANPIPES